MVNATERLLVAIARRVLYDCATCHGAGHYPIPRRDGKAEEDIMTCRVCTELLIAMSNIEPLI